MSIVTGPIHNDLDGLNYYWVEANWADGNWQTGKLEEADNERMSLSKPRGSRRFFD